MNYNIDPYLVQIICTQQTKMQRHERSQLLSPVTVYISQQLKANTSTRYT